MRIYVDYDDCLCETARSFVKLAKEMFGRNAAYEDIRFFELDKSFALDEDQYARFMIRGHEPDVLLSYEETPGASAVINEWIAAGHNVSIITGRPCSSFEASREWLDRHGLQNTGLYCLDKYGRENFVKNSRFSLTLDDYLRMKFDCAVEDSPLAFRFFGHLPDLKVMVFDRPWNRTAEFPNSNYCRCCDWESVRAAVMQTLTLCGNPAT